MPSKLIALLLACAACSGCASDLSATPPPAAASASSADASGPAATLPQIRALVGAAACTDSAQCRSAPLGSRACGGPEAYLAWSTAATAAAPLQQLLDRYRREREQADAAAGMQSVCTVVPDPGAQCRAGVCQLRGAGPDRS